MTTETAAAPARVFFRKELPQIPIIAGGSAVGWEVLDGQRGRAWFDPTNEQQAKVISDLRALARARVGGVVEISEQEYENLKKNHPFRRVVRPDDQIQPIRSQTDFLPKVTKRGAPAAVVKAVAQAAGVPVMTLPGRQPLLVGTLASDGSVQIQEPPTPTSAPWKPPVENPEVRPTVGKMRSTLKAGKVTTAK